MNQLVKDPSNMGVILLYMLMLYILFNSKKYRRYKTPQEVVVIDHYMEARRIRRFIFFTPVLKIIYVLKTSDGGEYKVKQSLYKQIKIGDKVILHKGKIKL